MHSASPRQETPSTPNAFDPLFLERVTALDEPPTSEADTAGPWRVEPVDDGWGCFAPAAGEPEVVFVRRDLALLAAAALPASGAARWLRLQNGRHRPYSVRDPEGPVGRVRFWRDELVLVMNGLAALLRRPADLAHLLEAAGHDTLCRAGEILAERVAGERPSELP
jgi:hypothetical protein